MSIRHSTVLRAVGRLLDIEGASAFSLDQSVNSLSLNWSVDPVGPRVAEYAWDELSLLDEVGQVNRGQNDGLAVIQAESWCEMLRTLGQDLDKVGAVMSTVSGDGNEVIATWFSKDEFRARRYTAAELWDASRRRASERQSRR